MHPKISTCPACTLLCDDIEIRDGHITNACHKGQAFFQIEIDEKPIHHVSGKPADIETCVSAAISILKQAKAPLVCGLEHLTTQAQQFAWKIAERTGAILDTTMSNQGRSSMFALQRVGKVTATLGEIASRSDVVVCWFCDPMTTHPRLFERLGRLDNGKRRLIVIDETDTKTVSEADQFFQVQHEKAPALLAVLRALLSGNELDLEVGTRTCGLDASQIGSLFSDLTSAAYGSVFYGQKCDESAFDLEMDSLNTLIRKLNDVTRFVGMKLRSDNNALSAENVLAWSSSYPFAINFGRKYPRFNWLEHSAETVLNRGECDAVLFATGIDLPNTFSGLSRTAKEHMGSIPKIGISPIQNIPADVSFQVGIPGLNEAGEFCRNDDVSIPLGAVKKPIAATSELILGKVLEGLD